MTEVGVGPQLTQSQSDGAAAKRIGAQSLEHSPEGSGIGGAREGVAKAFKVRSLN
jgi:hypothetical protein